MLGCLLIGFLAVSPRFAMVAIWVLTDWEDRAFGGWLVPVLGIVFLPWTTVLYTLGFVWGGDTAVPWGILGAIIGVFCDVMSYASSAKPIKSRYQGAT